MSDELKPCPLCGGPVRIHRRTDGQVDGIVCDECLLTLEAVDVYPEWHTLDELVRRWNARAAVTDEQFAMAIHDGRAWRAVRECRITDVHDFRDGSRTFFLSCGHQRHGERGTRFRYCDICGAKVAAPSELTCHMNHVLLYDEEDVEGIECDECGWEDIHGWDEPMPERCPGCNRKVVG